MGEALRGQLQISGWYALALSIGVVVLYAFFTVVLAVFGQRLRARLSVFSVAFLALIGSVTARAMLGREPTMAGGLLVLAELLILQALFQALRRHGLHLRLHAASAKAVMVDGQVNHGLLRATRLHEPELMVRLRQAGITQRSQVAYAIIESDGALTVIRTGTPVDAELLAGVAGL